ncbi:hypothetical protein [Cohnella cellulosilytica]|uniref:WD40 repeat protein n=1 Tax=Cohnella cellulosilytica TaxID=986710 RepID=A0ABW2F8V2_9BACL
MIAWRNAGAAIGLASVLLLAGCGSQWGADREEIEIANRTITVLDNPEQAAYEVTEIDELVRLNDLRGTDWLSDEQLLVDRENADRKPERAEGADWYPRNVYIHELSGGTETPIDASDSNQGYAVASPDKTKVFYKSFSLQSNTGQGHIANLATGESTAFTAEDAMTVDNGRWIDNDSLVYATIQGQIFEWRTDASRAKPRLLLDSEEMFPGNLALLGDRLFYTTLKGALMIQSPTEQVQLKTKGSVIWMVPSPDEQRLAVVVRSVQSREMELLIVDLQGSVLHAVAQDSQLYGLAWSPDGSRLAYAAITQSGTVRGIYVADASTGLSVPLSLDIKFLADPLRWNPSGNRLMVTSTLPDEQQNRNRFATYLVRVP